jgi:superoxide reductase
MAKRLEVYKCDLCGNIVTVLEGGEGELVCCGEPMKLFEEKTADKSTEKHVPVVEKTSNGYTVTVGTTLHPMEADHYIMWIELVVDGKSYRQFLKPGDAPSAVFCVSGGGAVYAREYCNKHGLWKGE